MKSATLALLSMFFLSSAVATDTPSVTVKPIGALFIEAPPGRDKDLSPFGSFGEEKVEVHAVVAFTNRLIVDIPTIGEESKVQVTAILLNKTQVPLGTANSSNFRKVSQDGRKTLVSLSIKRLPDSAVSAIAFKGSLQLPVASSIKRTSVAFQPKEGGRLDFGFGSITISKVQGDTMTLSGDNKLAGIAAIKIIKPDGSTIEGKRSGYTRMGDAVTSEWRFNAPISPGKVEAGVYHELANLEVPISLMVAKPY